MRRLFLLLALLPLAASAQTSRSTLSTLGLPKPAGTIIGNCTAATGFVSTCIAGPGITISNGQISASGSSQPAGGNFSVQYNAAGTLAGTGPGTAGNCLLSNGTTSAPTFQSCPGGGGGAVSSVSAGTSGTLSVSPTTGATVVDLASAAAFTVVGNSTSSPAVPVATGMQALAGAMVTVNENTIAATLSSGATNDYSPGGWGSTVAYLHLTPAAGGSTLNGLVAGSNMQTVLIDNAEAAGGADNIILANESTSDTTAANRFHSSGYLVIPPGGRVVCVDSSTLARWSCQ